VTGFCILRPSGLVVVGPATIPAERILSGFVLPPCPGFSHE